jgi:multidrug transporter EmrE-like cation transporter
MTPIAWIIVLVALMAAVGGQIFLKKSMQSSHGVAGFRSRAVAIPFATGIVLMTVQFFLNLGLLQRYDLSFIYPFQGLSVIIITFAAALTLREKLTLQLIAGSLLISLGVALVSLT